MSNHQIHTEIEINASAEKVWRILTDFSAYSDWNPFIKSIDGVLEEGTKLSVFIQPEDSRGMTLHPSVLVAHESKEFRWRGNLLMPGIFSGEHCFLIKKISEDKVLFQHSEKFTGLLVPLLKASLDRGTQSGFIAMNQALKTRAESEGNSITSN